MVASLRSPALLACSLSLFLGTLSSLPAAAVSEANSITTCTSAVSGHVTVLKTSSDKCRQNQYVEEWNRAIESFSSPISTEIRRITVCTPKAPSQNYALIQARCFRNQITQRFIREVSLPATPVIQAVSAVDEDSLRVIIRSSSDRDALMNFRYRFVNIETGKEEKSIKEREGSYRVSNLSANTAYRFTVYAENIDGLSMGSLASDVVKTLAKPIRIVTEVSQNNGSAGVRTYQLGDTGPGGGRIFYVDLNGFNCGIGHTNTGSPTGALCNYLEVAPSTWNSTSTDPLRPWALTAGGLHTTAVPNLSLFDSSFTDSARIGSGYSNSLAIVAQGNDHRTAAGLARSYQGGGQSDWYLGHIVEMSLLCQWVVGQNPSVLQTCSGSSFVNSNFEQDNDYASSSQVGNSASTYQSFKLTGGVPLEIDNTAKSGSYYVRPMRAF